MPLPVYDLLRESPDTLGAAVNVLVQTYFADANPAMLLSDLDPSGPEAVGVGSARDVVEPLPELLPQFKVVNRRACRQILEDDLTLASASSTISANPKGT